MAEDRKPTAAQLEAGTIVIPEYEQKIADAAARGDNDKIAEVQEEYHAERAKQVKSN